MINSPKNVLNGPKLPTNEPIWDLLTTGTVFEQRMFKFQ